MCEQNPYPTWRAWAKAIIKYSMNIAFIGFYQI